MDFDSLRNAGTMAGSGGVIVMDRYDLHDRGARVGGEVLRRRVLRAMLTVPRRDRLGPSHHQPDHRGARGVPQDLDDLLAIAGDMEGNTICVFADAAAWPVQSYIAKFRDEFEEYIRSDRGAGQEEAPACPA